jgi:hypothetical protein
LRLHVTTMRMAIITKTISNKCWDWCDGEGNPCVTGAGTVCDQKILVFVLQMEKSK